MNTRPTAPAIWKQLLLWILIPSTMLWITAVADTFYVALRITGAMLDNDLEDSARIIASRIELAQGRPVLSMSDDALEILRGDGPARLFYAMRREDGSLIRGDSAMPWPPKPEDPDSTAETVEIGQVKGRMNTLRITLDGYPSAIFVQVAESLAERDAVITRTINEVLIPMGCMLLAAGVCVWVGIRRGLKPLNSLTQTIQQRSPAALTPIDLSNAPLEIRPLVTALNDLLARLSNEMTWQKRFLSTSAHQLRTPLAGLKTNWELLKRQGGFSGEDAKPIVAAVDLTMERLVRMVSQLLSLARAEPGALGNVEPVNFGKVIERVAVELAPGAARKNIEIDVSAVSPNLVISADANHFFDLVMNLLDNAIRYTPGPGRIGIALEQRGGALVFSVEDDGPGIPEQFRERVMEPFFRMPGASPEGTGLGLAIANEIAGRYGGTLSIGAASGGSGARVEVRVPALAAQMCEWKPAGSGPVQSERSAAEINRQPV